VPKEVVRLVELALAVFDANEELATVRVRAGVCHGHCAECVLTQDRLVRELITGATSAGAVRAASLDHKTGNDPVKCKTGVVPRLNLVDKMVDAHRGELRIKIHHNRSLRSLDCHSIDGVVIDIHFWGFAHMPPWCHRPERHRYLTRAATPAGPFSTLMCMRHPTLSILTLVAASALFLAACGGNENGDIVVQTSSTTTAPPADTSPAGPAPADGTPSTDSTTSAPTSTTEVEAVGEPTSTTTTAPQAGQGTALTDQARVSTLGLGPVFMGDTLEEVTEKIGVALDPEELGNEVCRYYAAPGGPPGVAFMVSFGRISRVDISDPSTITTRSGAGIGSTKDEIVALFGTKIVVSPSPEGEGELLTFVPSDDNDSNLRIVFETNPQGVVTKYRTGQLPEVDYTPGCP